MWGVSADWTHKMVFGQCFFPATCFSFGKTSKINIRGVLPLFSLSLSRSKRSEAFGGPVDFPGVGRAGGLGGSLSLPSKKTVFRDGRMGIFSPVSVNFPTRRAISGGWL